MTRITYILAFWIYFGTVYAQKASLNSQKNISQNKLLPNTFVENKGQISFGDFSTGHIQYYSNQKNKRFYFRHCGRGIEHYKIESELSSGKFNYEFERIDFEFKEYNENVKINGINKSNRTLNFYKEQGLFENVNCFERLYYTDIYPNIDLIFYLIDGDLKYDVILNKGAQIDNFKVAFKGGIPLVENQIISYETSLFSILENITKSYFYLNGIEYDCNVNFKQIQKGQYGFILPQNTEFDSLVVDSAFKHTRKIATYYGDDDEDRSFDVTTDKHNRIYTTGRTNSSSLPMSSSSVHQGTLGGAQDAFVAKFDPKLKTLMWSTFYGGDDEAFGIAVSTDKDIFIAGHTKCTTAIATTGAHQTKYGGDIDGFIAKFDSIGKIQFGTYYVGGKEDVINSIYAVNNNLFVTGLLTVAMEQYLRRLLLLPKVTKIRMRPVHTIQKNELENSWSDIGKFGFGIAACISGLPIS